MRVRCSSPSCARALLVTMSSRFDSAMRAAGWSMERQPGDERARPYCERCREVRS